MKAEQKWANYSRIEQILGFSQDFKEEHSNYHCDHRERLSSLSKKVTNSDDEKMMMEGGLRGGGGFRSFLWPLKQGFHGWYKNKKVAFSYDKQHILILSVYHIGVLVYVQITVAQKRCWYLAIFINKTYAEFNLQTFGEKIMNLHELGL